MANHRFRGRYTYGPDELWRPRHRMKAELVSGTPVRGSYARLSHTSDLTVYGNWPRLEY